MRARRADPIRLIALRLGQDELRHVVQRPGVNEALRVTIQYYDGRYPNQAATLMRGHGAESTLLVVYDRPGRDVRFAYPIALERYVTLFGALRRAGFDALDDQPDVPFFGVDLWLVERASGSFYHDVVLQPESAAGLHGEIVSAIREQLNEALRPVVA